MADVKESKSFYLSTILGAVSLMLLRICAEAGGLSISLAIFGMTAFVYSVRHAPSKKEYGFLAGIMALSFAVRFYGYTGKPSVDIILGLLIGLIMFSLLCTERIAKRFEDSFWYTLIFPSMYLLYMYFTEAVKINMPFRMDLYFSIIPVLCHISAFLGIYFLDFLIAWTASILVFFIDHQTSRESAILAIVYIIMLIGITTFGIVHLNKMDASEAAKNDTVSVACVSGPYCGSLSDASYKEFSLNESIDSLTKIIRDAAEKDTEIMIFSEEAYCVQDNQEDFLLDKAEQMAAQYNMHLLLAYEVEDTDGSEEGKSINKICWISNEGDILYDYTKHCIVPFIETAGYVRGDKTIEAFNICVHGKTLKVAAAICYDADFDLFMSHMGKNVDLLFLPTWDWNVIAEEHFSVARLRAISSETTLVRSAYDGWNAVIDSAGNTLLCVNTNDIGYESVIVCDVPIR